MLNFLKKFKGHEAPTWDPDVASQPPKKQKSLHQFFQDSPSWDQDRTSEPLMKKKGLWQRFQDAKRKEIPPEEVLKYTGRTKEQILEWAKTEPGVAGNQPAGYVKPTFGGTSGQGPNSNAPPNFLSQSARDSTYSPTQSPRGGRGERWALLSACMASILIGRQAQPWTRPLSLEEILFLPS
jgi:hypothetical protein